jgi:hypothetical protein
VVTQIGQRDALAPYRTPHERQRSRRLFFFASVTDLPITQVERMV